jgi:UDP-galactopyranose mutase
MIFLQYYKILNLGEMRMEKICETTDLLVFSHLRWDFVFQRPQHLMSRFAKYRRVYYVEEPVFSAIDYPRLELKVSKPFKETMDTRHLVNIIIPHLPANIASCEIESTLIELVDELIFSEKIDVYSLWYYTPMALPFTRHLKPNAILFDCMDELSLFRGAPQALLDLEEELIQKAHVVFTGGESLYQAKKNRHHNIHALPSSIDYDHFANARKGYHDPNDQKNIAHPRIGFYGVVDERFDVDLLAQMAELKPTYNFIILGPVAKIDPETLPKAKNIHYLGLKEYSELPRYVANWDCAMMPFALNDSTKFISPTKTPEFLAAGQPVVSTAINDVVHPYEDEGLAHIAHSPTEFCEMIDKAMKEKNENPSWLKRVDLFLKKNSWDKTFQKIAEHESALLSEPEFHNNHLSAYVYESDSYIVLNEVQ